MWPDEFPNDEIHVRHNGTVWLVTHLEVQHHFEMQAAAIMYANYLRHQHRGEDRLRVILHRAYTEDESQNDRPQARQRL